MPFFNRSLAGPGYIVLNTVRAMNIIGLLAVIAASSVMLVKTFVVSKFFFFDGVSHVITALLSSKLKFIPFQSEPANRAFKQCSLSSPNCLCFETTLLVIGRYFHLRPALSLLASQ